MRMPLEVQRASMLVLGALTSSPENPIIRLRGRAVHCGNSREIAAQDQCSRGIVAALLVIAGPPSDLAETGPPAPPPETGPAGTAAAPAGCSRRLRETPRSRPSPQAAAGAD